MRKGLLYLHGKGGTILEAQHYVPLFQAYDVVGMDYQAQTPWEAKEEFCRFFDSFLSDHESVVIIANSLGAYYALHALSGKPIEKAYFISPIVDMESVISQMLLQIDASEKDLREKEIIETDFGETLSWKYLSWVRDHPVSWHIPTNILYGEYDSLQSLDRIKSFASEVPAQLTVMENGEHWFHTSEQMKFLDNWILEDLRKEKGKSYEYSCGAVVFRRAGTDIEYLLIRSPDGFWGFPKGHLEFGESEHAAAVREIMEETGLKVSFLDGFRMEDEHALAREGFPNTIKKVVYFLAEYNNQTPNTQDPEIEEIKQMNYSEAMDRIHNENLRRILQKADVLLRDRFSEQKEGCL